MNNANSFIRQFAKLLSQYSLTINDIKKGKIVIDNVEINLDTLTVDKEYFTVDVKETIFEPLGYQLTDSNSVSKIIELGTHPKDTCKVCGSSLKKKWFGLKNTEKCINPNCSEYFDRGFEVININTPLLKKVGENTKSEGEKPQPPPVPSKPSLLAPQEYSKSLPNNYYPDTVI